MDFPFIKNKTLFNTALGIVQKLRNNGYTAYLVGGCVRDLLMGREPHDYDIATSAVPETIAQLFPNTLEVGRKFGVMIVIENGYQFQVATFRSETGYEDGRHPSAVTYSTPEDDAKRRDFTCNGLFFDPIEQKFLDWVGGLEDIKQKILRTIGDPNERFAEDHLRMLRAVRFAIQLGFRIDAATFNAIIKNAHTIHSISIERIRDELERMFNPAFQTVEQPYPEEWLTDNVDALQSRPKALYRALELLRASTLLKEILPEVAATIDCSQNSRFHPEDTVYKHILLMLQEVPPDADPLLPWCVLLHDVGKPITRRVNPVSGETTFYEHDKVGAALAHQILTRLRFPNKQIKTVVHVVRYHMQFKDVPNMRKSTLRRMIMRETFPLELELHRLDCLGSHRDLSIYEFLKRELSELLHRPEIIPPLLTGDDLIKLGMQPGPKLGQLLSEIREKQLQDELKTREEALQWAMARIRDIQPPPTSSTHTP